MSSTLIFVAVLLAFVFCASGYTTVGAGYRSYAPYPLASIIVIVLVLYALGIVRV